MVEYLTYDMGSSNRPQGCVHDEEPSPEQQVLIDAIASLSVLRDGSMSTSGPPLGLVSRSFRTPENPYKQMVARIH